MKNTATTKVQLKLSIKGARDDKFTHHYCGTEDKGMNEYGNYFGALQNFDHTRYGYNHNVWLTEQGEREDYRIQDDYRAKLDQAIAQHLEQGFNKLASECHEIEHKIQQQMISAQKEALVRITGQQPVLSEEQMEREHKSLMWSLKRDTKEMEEWLEDSMSQDDCQHQEQCLNQHHRYREKVLKLIAKINGLCDEAQKPHKIDPDTWMNTTWRELSETSA